MGPALLPFQEIATASRGISAGRFLSRQVFPGGPPGR